MSSFIPGLELSKLFFQEAVRPIIEEDFPHLRYSAALIGEGSEVLGFDTEMSSDHDWGPRLMLFLHEEDYAPSRDALDQSLRHKLPHTFRGYSTNFTPPDDKDNGTQLLEATESGPVNHHVELHTLHTLFLDYLAFDLNREIEPSDWLTFPEQKLRSITHGAIFHDAVGMEAALARFQYYPHDVWLYLLASGWNRIGQEEHLMGRAGVVGDDLGSAIIASRLVRDLMRLCFLMEKRYAPYPKWFGTAFRELSSAEGLLPVLVRAHGAAGWQEREEHLAAAYEQVAAMHNELRITDPLPAMVTNFFSRPFKVIALRGFAEAIRDRITDEAVKRIAQKRLLGSIDQLSDSTDLISDAQWRTTLKHLYG